MPDKKPEAEDRPNMFVEPQSPFDEFHFCRTLVETATQIGIDIKDQDAFVKKLRHYEYGYSAEVECAAILAWLGNCSLVHLLAQDAFASSDVGDVIVPDLLAVFSRDGHTLPVAIEVKSTNSLYLPCSDEYRAKLRRYSELFNLPLLLAWRPRKFGHWLLVDVFSDKVVSEGRIHVTQALMHNLMPVVAGDFFIQAMPGVGLHFRSKIIGDKVPEKKGFSATSQIQQAYFGTRHKQLEGLSQSSIGLLFTASSEQYAEEKGGMISQ